MPLCVICKINKGAYDVSIACSNNRSQIQGLRSTPVFQIERLSARSQDFWIQPQQQMPPSWLKFCGLRVNEFGRVWHRNVCEIEQSVWCRWNWVAAAASAVYPLMAARAGVIALVATLMRTSPRPPCFPVQSFLGGPLVLWISLRSFPSSHLPLSLSPAMPMVILWVSLALPAHQLLDEVCHKFCVRSW